MGKAITIILLGLLIWVVPFGLGMVIFPGSTRGTQSTRALDLDSVNLATMASSSFAPDQP
jgi:hypothetical protein